MPKKCSSSHFIQESSPSVISHFRNIRFVEHSDKEEGDYDGEEDGGEDVPLWTTHM